MTTADTTTIQRLAQLRAQEAAYVEAAKQAGAAVRAASATVARIGAERNRAQVAYLADRDRLAVLDDIIGTCQQDGETVPPSLSIRAATLRLRISVHDGARHLAALEAAYNAAAKLHDEAMEQHYRASSDMFVTAQASEAAERQAQQEASDLQR